MKSDFRNRAVILAQNGPGGRPCRAAGKTESFSLCSVFSTSKNRAPWCQRVLLVRSGGELSFLYSGTDGRKTMLIPVGFGVVELCGFEPLVTPIGGLGTDPFQ